jgi:PilZ domain
LKPEGLRVTSGQRPDPLANPNATSARPFGPALVPTKAKENGSPGRERRRAQRVTLRVPASVHVALQGKQASFGVTTVSVSSGGALLVLEKALAQETRLVLEHGRTRERIACRVTRPAREIPEGFQVAVEFDSPAPDFWGVAFPPADWRPVE